MAEDALYQRLRECLVLMEWAGQRVLAPFDLNVGQYDALSLLQQTDGQRLGELRQQLLIDNSKMTRLADQLERRRLAERRQEETDRRAWRLHLTPAGVELLAAARVAHQTMLVDRFAIFDADEQDQFAQLLDRLRNRWSLKNPYETSQRRSDPGHCLCTWRPAHADAPGAAGPPRQPVSS